MRKKLKIVSNAILIIACLSLYGFTVRYVTNGGERLGFFTKPIAHFVNFPSTVYKVLKSDELKGIPPTFRTKDPTFEEMNNLEYDLFGITSFYNPDEIRWDIKLFNFKNDSLIHEWYLYRENYFKSTTRKFENSRPTNVILLPDRSIMVYFGRTMNLYKLDKDSKIIWHNTSTVFHHAIEKSNDGNIWVATTEDRGFKLARRDQPGVFKDDCITKICSQTGRIIYNKSITDILIENNYKSIVYGSSNDIDPDFTIDPLHLNDIQPARSDSRFWKKDDLFLSLRHKSLVIQFRPVNNKIIRLIQGPFLYQHDVDIVSDNEIAIFNNNTTNIGVFNIDETSQLNVSDELLNSEILIYNLKDSSYRKFLNDKFIEENIYSRSEGKYDFLSSGDVYVESQNDSKIYIMNDEEIVLKKQFETSMENKVYTLNWIRVYENIEF